MDRATALGTFGVAHFLPTYDEWYKAAYPDTCQIIDVASVLAQKPTITGKWDNVSGTADTDRRGE